MQNWIFVKKIPAAQRKSEYKYKLLLRPNQNNSKTKSNLPKHLLIISFKSSRELQYK